MNAGRMANGGMPVLAILAIASTALAGSLTPPGAPGPTMKPLDQVEPRTPISQDDIPLLIDQPGSYYLTENLTVAAVDTSAIEITTDSVSIDLMGFTITGPGKDSGWGGSGIYGEYRDNCGVVNGTIQGFADAGVYLGDTGMVSGVRVIENGLYGILMENSAEVKGCVAEGQGREIAYAYGIVVGSGSVVTDCVCRYNIAGDGSGRGIDAAHNSVISGNRCENNDGGGTSGGGYGIDASYACVITNNTCRYNEGSGSGNGCGIVGRENCVIRDNVAESNDAGGTGYCYGIKSGSACTVAGNTCINNDSTAGSAYGIYALHGCSIRDNVCRANSTSNDSSPSGGSFGISASAECTITGNACTDNTNDADGGYAHGIKVLDRSVVRDNLVAQNNANGLGATNGLAYGIDTGENCLIIGNNCMENRGKGNGTAIGIVADDDCRIENNHCTDHSGASAMSYGIMVEGDNTVVISNTCANNANADITFWTTADLGYAAGNLTDTPITDQGANNENGTTPAANAVF